MSYSTIILMFMAGLSITVLSKVTSDQASGFNDQTMQLVNGNALFFVQFNLTDVQNDNKGKINVLIGQSSNMNDSYTYAYKRFERCNGINTQMALSCMISADGIAVSLLLRASKIREISNIQNDSYVQIRLKYLDKIVYSLPVHIGPAALSDEERAILQLRSEYDNEDKRNTKDIVVTKKHVYIVTKFSDKKALQDNNGLVKVLMKNTTTEPFQPFKYLRFKDCKERKHMEAFTCTKRTFGFIADLFLPISLLKETLFIRFEVRYWNNVLQEYVSIQKEFAVMAKPLLLNGLVLSNDVKNNMLPDSEKKLGLCCQAPTECTAVISTRSDLVLNSSSTCTMNVPMIQSESTNVSSTGTFTRYEIELYLITVAPEPPWSTGMFFLVFLFVLVAATLLCLVSVAVKQRRRQWKNDNVAHV